MGLTDVPIALPIPENGDVLKALSRYQEAYRQKVDEMEALCRKKNDELKKVMCEYLLPEIVGVFRGSEG